MEIKVGEKRYGPLSYNIAQALLAKPLSHNSEEFLNNIKTSILNNGRWPNNQNMVIEKSFWDGKGIIHNRSRLESFHNWRERKGSCLSEKVLFNLRWCFWRHFSRVINGIIFEYSWWQTFHSHQQNHHLFLTYMHQSDTEIYW